MRPIRLAKRGAALLGLVALHVAVARGVAAWDAGGHLLGGGVGAVLGVAVVGAAVLVRAVAYFVVPAIAAHALASAAASLVGDVVTRPRTGYGRAPPQNLGPNRPAHDEEGTS